MTKIGIIKPIQEPVDWVNSLVIGEKANGSPLSAEQEMKRIIRINFPNIKHNI